MPPRNLPPRKIEPSPTEPLPGVALVLANPVKDLTEEYAHVSEADDFHAPVDAFAGTCACACCSIWRKDKQTYRMMTQMALDGVGNVQVCEFLASRGFAISQSMLNRHIRRHLKPRFLELATEAGMLERLAGKVLGSNASDLAVATAKALMIPLLDALQDLKRGAFREMAKSDPVKFVSFVSQVNKQLAEVQSAAYRSEAMQAKLVLDRLRTKDSYERAFLIAQREMAAKLSETPEGRKMLPELQVLLNAPKANG